MTRGFRAAVALALVAGALAACGGDDDTTPDASEGAAFGDETDDAAEAIGEAMGAGGSGTIIIDGEEIAITSATCMLGDGTFDVGTVSDNGMRAFATRNRPDSDASAQILDADMVQWFPQDVQGDEAVRDGSTITVGPHTWFNNQNDTTIEASFTVECP